MDSLFVSLLLVGATYYASVLPLTATRGVGAGVGVGTRSSLTSSPLCSTVETSSSSSSSSGVSSTSSTSIPIYREICLRDPCPGSTRNTKLLYLILFLLILLVAKVSELVDKEASTKTGQEIVNRQ